MASIREERIRTNGVELHCLVSGEGPLVVLLHGWPQSSHAWRKTIPALAKRFRVVAPDMRGFGKSDKPPRVRDYATPVLADDVRGLIEACGEKKAHVVGHDWGGAVTWETASRHPDAVDRVAVVNCPPAWVLARHLLSNPRQMLRSWYIMFFQLPWLPEMLIHRKIESVFLSSTADPSAFTGDDLAAYREALTAPGAATGSVNYYRAAARALPFRMKAAKKKIEAPILLIWGEKDVALGKELTYGLDRYAANLKIFYVPDASHWVVEEKPALVAKLLLEHLGGTA